MKVIQPKKEGKKRVDLMLLPRKSCETIGSTFVTQFYGWFSDGGRRYHLPIDSRRLLSVRQQQQEVVSTLRLPTSLVLTPQIDWAPTTITSSVVRDPFSFFVYSSVFGLTASPIPSGSYFIASNLCVLPGGAFFSSSS